MITVDHILLSATVIPVVCLKRLLVTINTVLQFKKKKLMQKYKSVAAEIFIWCQRVYSPVISYQAVVK